MDEPRIRLEEFPEHLRNTLASPTDPTNLDMRIKAVITKIENLLPRLTKEESDISVLTKWKTSDWGTTNKKDILQTILQRSRRPIIKYISLGPQASSGSTVPLDFPGILERRMFALMTSFDGLILNPSLEEQLKSGMTRVYVQKLRRTCEQELAPLAVPGCVILPTDNDNETRNTPDDPSHLSSTTESCLPIEDTSLACIVDAGVECNRSKSVVQETKAMIKRRIISKD
ncbi:hypothetical protein GQX73_g6767 [Xylaria multiplex]|uniref:Uncharacterized protein n=1 Tax=Xylaria multiplex TaxID=323545 RepID=A0A7C8N2P8_9PEZI|nr:hypothetical protein GQX73_g6767 [Xylaria multiplex]